MKKRLIILFILITFYSNAQHCGFDFSGIVVLNIHSKIDSTNIPNLKITLLDSLNKVVETKFWRKDKNSKMHFVNDTLKFWQNPDKTYYLNINPTNNSNIRFPFAKENYVLVCNYDFKIKDYKIKIEDIDGLKNQGKFKTIIIKPKQIEVYPLCGNYDLNIYPGNFKVIEIILKSR